MQIQHQSTCTAQFSLRLSSPKSERHLHFEASRLHKALPAADNINITEMVHNKAVSVYLGSHTGGSAIVG